MAKLDLTKQYRDYYRATLKPTIAEFEKVSYLAITGKGDPSSAAFLEDIQALYPVAYAIKFACKEKGNDFTVPKLEGQWWFDHEKYRNVTLDDAPTRIPRSEWHYRLLLRLPDFVNPPDVTHGIEQAVRKNKPGVEKVNLFTLPASKVVQILHVGPFDREPESLAKLAAFMEAEQLTHAGQHQEIYLSDFRKTPPAKLKTILREPVK